MKVHHRIHKSPYVISYLSQNNSVDTTISIISKVMLFFVGYAIPTAVYNTSYIFWEKISCSALEVNRRFGGTCRLHSII
jgi:hypothetical protein